MTFLYGKEYKKEDLLNKIGDISQIAGAREITLNGGMHDGVKAVDFRTGSGFNFLVVPDRGLDITIAEHNGRPIAWRAPAGEVSPYFHNEFGFGWLRSFPGGLLTTCGLVTAGAPSEDDGEQLGIHGRYSSTPASNVWVDGEWDGDDYWMWVCGKVRESRIFGENLLMKRKISTKLGSNVIYIDDEVTNESTKEVPFMILYHINGGYPAIDTGSKMYSPTKKAIPRDADAEVDKENYFLIDPPTDGYKERCYYHDMMTDKDGFVTTALINKNMPNGVPFGFYVKYNKNELPKFTQWKMNGTKEYVVGMEPANCWVEGRAKERERGTLHFIKPNEVRKFHLEIGVIESHETCQQIEDAIKACSI
ncbi:MAG: aldose 1-epimerase family protein [Armatimonadota bacterium]